ncbi:hypothetical protein RAB80_016096 [Fusarium oxysporum f. sp. vasinfectum]|nr:hypothetical protein RAB80_016096 [Fusarium oxysporum f. sp. vasinfectum]
MKKLGKASLPLRRTKHPSINSNDLYIYTGNDLSQPISPCSSLPDFSPSSTKYFENPSTSDAQFYFILAARGCLSIASWCKGLRGITEGLMTIGWQNGTFKREEWTNNSMIEDIRATTRELNQEGTYSSLYPINLDSTSESMDDIGMEALAGEFQRLSSQNEPTRGKEVEMTSEPNVWKGDQRDLDLTLTEATEEEKYT